MMDDGYWKKKIATLVVLFGCRAMVSFTRNGMLTVQTYLTFHDRAGRTTSLFTPSIPFPALPSHVHLECHGGYLRMVAVAGISELHLHDGAPRIAQGTCLDRYIVICCFEILEATCACRISGEKVAVLTRR